jgi:hypothetical protein
MQTSKTLFLWLVLLFSGIIFSYAQKPKKLTFERARAMPYGLFGMACAADSTKIYLFGGASAINAFTNSVLLYDSRLGEWFDLTANNQMTVFRYGRAVYSDKHKCIILAQGITNAASFIAKAPDILCYDVTNYAIKSLGPNLLQTKSPGLAVWDYKIYAFGGSSWRDLTKSNDARYEKRMFSYDLSNGHVEFLPDMPEAKEADGGIVDGKLYVFGGFDDQPNKSIHSYDLKTRSWSKVAEFESAVSSFALTQYGQYFILVGDFNDKDRLIVFDTSNGTWKEFKMNFKVRNAAAAIIGTTLHVMGGRSGMESPPLSSHWTIPVEAFIPKSSQQ